MTLLETEAPVGNVCGFILGGSNDEAPTPFNNLFPSRGTARVEEHRINASIFTGQLLSPIH